MVEHSGQQLPGSAGRRVAVFGGGPGGLSAAHELAERGFEVTVYERHDVLGGKTRSFSLPGTGTGGRKDLPAELGPHVMFGSYRNIGETLSRIPVGEGRCVADNFVPRDQGAVLSVGWAGSQLHLPSASADLSALFGPGTSIPPALGIAAVTGLVGRIGDAFTDKLTPADVAILLTKVLALATSGTKRQWGELEHTSLTDYLGADRLSPDARELLVAWMQVNTQAPDRMNARVAGVGSLHHFFGTLFGSGLGPGMRNLIGLPNGPLNEIWFDPWREHLEKLGATVTTSTALSGLSCAGGRITGATVRGPDGRDRAVTADYYVLALPPDKVPALLTDELVAPDPGLGRIANIEQTWLGAQQIYLTKPAPIPDVGFNLGPWALAYTHPHPRVWTHDFQDEYGDGSVVSHVSVDVARWDRPGVLHGKPAIECSAAERFEEIRAQLRADLGDETLLPDEDVHSFCANPALSQGPDGRVINDEPLFATTPSCWANQPEAVTAIPNLFLAASYVRTVHGTDSTDCANEAGKRAANGILAAAGDPAAPAPIAEFSGGAFALAWAEDDRRYEAGLPNAFDYRYRA